MIVHRNLQLDDNAFELFSLLLIKKLLALNISKYKTCFISLIDEFLAIPSDNHSV